MAELTILADIETNVIDRLKNGGLSQVKTFEIKKDSDIKFSCPAVRNVIADGTFTPIGQKSFRVDVNLYVIIIFKNVSDEEARRKGIYPIMSGVVALLAGQKLDLSIDELTPLGFREITNAQDIEQGIIVFQMVFSTKFYIEKSEEAALALLKLGMSFYLQDITPAPLVGSSVLTLPTS